MDNVRSMGYESNLEPGVAVVFGTKEHFVNLPGTSGTGVPAGVYCAQLGHYKDMERPDTDDAIAVVRSGYAKVVAGGTVAPGDFAYVDSSTGKLKKIPATAGTYWSYGQFEEAGASGEYVDFNVNIQQITVEAS